MRSCRVALAGAAISIFGAGGAAEAQTNVRFVLDWAWQAMHGPFLIAREEGYYAEAGLEVTIDRGFGSGDTISEVAAGAYDMGFAEGTSLLKLNTENPDDRVVTVLVINDQSPTGVIPLAENGVSAPADLMGEKISATQNAATVLVWPVFAELNGLEPYSSGIQVRRDFADENPEVVRGFVNATIRGMLDMFEDPDDGIELLKAREPLIDVEVETARWYLAEELAILTPSVLERGISAVDQERYQTAARQVAAAFELDVDPVMSDYYDGSFLPPLDEREIPAEVKARVQ